MKRPNPTKATFRLTVSKEAFNLLVPTKIKTFGALKRPDGKIDVLIKSATANLLRQLGEPKENLSDVVVRILTKKGTSNVDHA